MQRTPRLNLDPPTGTAQQQTPGIGQAQVLLHQQTAAVQHQLLGRQGLGRPAELAVTADAQHAVQHPGGAGEAVIRRVAQQQPAASGLAQAASAAAACDAARDLQRLAGIHAEHSAHALQHQAALGGQHKAVGGHQGAAVKQQRAGGGLGRQAAKLGIGRDGELTAAQLRAAGIGIGAGQRQATTAQLGQRAGTADNTVKPGRRAVAAGRQHLTAELHLAARRAAAGQRAHGLVRLQRQHHPGRVGQGHRRAVDDGPAALQDQGAGVNPGRPGVAVGAGQRQAARPLFDQAAGATERAGVQRAVMVAAGSQGEAAQLDTAATGPAARQRADSLVGLQQQPRTGSVGQAQRHTVSQRRPALQHQGTGLDPNRPSEAVGPGQAEVPVALFD